MLVEPETDADRQAADFTLMQAMQARAMLGPAASMDAQALALRSLLHQAPDVSLMAVLRSVWGRLDSAGRPAIVVHGAEAQAFAADRFGLNFRLVAEAAAALAAAGGATRALIGLDERPWWGRMLLRPDLQVIGAFPDDTWGRPRALLIGAETTGPTGDDRTFWVTDSPLKEAAIIERLGQSGLGASLLSQGGGLKLFQLAGYVQAEDGRLDGAPGELRGVIGSAPVF